jgi:hypothetical protein
VTLWLESKVIRLHPATPRPAWAVALRLAVVGLGGVAALALGRFERRLGEPPAGAPAGADAAS